MKILILGGGISGLSSAWFCRHRYPEAETILLEKGSRLGGWMQTRREAGFLFEEGPRAFSWQRSPYLKGLVEELGLQSEVVVSKAKGNYLWQRGKLRSMRGMMLRCLPGLLWGKWKRGVEGDVSVYDFVVRKYGKRVAERLFDPLVLGIYAGDMRKLSFQSCFGKNLVWRRGELFTLRGGMGRLVEELERKVHVVKDCPVERMDKEGVIAGGKRWRADQIFCALPSKEVDRLAGPSLGLPMLSLWRVFLVYSQPVVPHSGFGYLVPTTEKEPVLGMIWDSTIFPEQNTASETRLTVMIRGAVRDPVREALSAARRHLGTEREPLYASVVRAEEAIPQFEVGYEAKLAQWKKELEKRFPKLRLVGNYLRGVSVEACVACAKETVWA